MTAYVAVHAKIKDPEKLAIYAQSAGATVAAHGGEFGIRAAIVETLTGPDGYNRFVMIQFPDADAARTWYNSAEYQALIPNRDAAADMLFTLSEAP
ncbi:MAG: DUF1330 domain-containing protein [Proteobacteria bacterium]|nr:DUF1330 domain-containing protein [Pseudomonadota bacterium]